MGKRKQKQKSDPSKAVQEEKPALPPVRTSEDVTPKREGWINKQRVLIFAARGINHRDRHLMKDIRTLMPHHRPECKMERSKSLSVVTEMCDMKHCNKAILFEGRRKRDLYMWVSNVPQGPSVKFLVENIHTMAELKMTGNCLRGSRPLLSFDAKFDKILHLKVLKELFVQTFGVARNHPKSQPFIDHVYTFTYLDNRIWFRNFQILSEDGGLTEIGPRFVMNPIKIFDGSFMGNTIWSNPDYVSPSRQRQMLKKAASDKYVSRIEQKAQREVNKPQDVYEGIEYDELFEATNTVQMAKLLTEHKKKEKKTIKTTSTMKVQSGGIKKKQMEAARKIIDKKKRANSRKVDKKQTIDDTEN